jgi:class 3 adenylate cyclase
MFTDFQAFTKHSQDLSPEKLVKSVDHFFSAFDKIIEKYGLEKIKTIGDAYMCTGGLISKGPMQPIKVIHAAFEILDFVRKESESDSDDIAHFDVRIGINTGPVVAGVVGTKKFAYDIWGDTVNVAARMETNSQAGMINISENTYELVKDQFECEYRGEIDVKNKGVMKMYFVLRSQKILNNQVTQAARMEEISSTPHKP